MTKDDSSSQKKVNYKGVIVFAVIAFFIYGAWTKVRVDLCLDDARDAYNKNWAATCKTTAKARSEGYFNCINNSNETESFCKSLWKPKQDASANCSLPIKVANQIDSRLDKDKNFCVSYG